MSELTRRGLLIILSSPSGAGKSTLAARLRDWDSDIEFSISATTRTPREGERDGKEYYFHDRKTFENLVSEGQMLEHAEVFGNLYGSPEKPVRDAILAGKDVLFDVDWQGGQQIKNSALGQHCVSFFILPPSIRELEKRLKTRALDTPEIIEARMLKSKDEISHWPEYDYILINDALDATEQKLRTIIPAERMRLSQQPNIVDTVRRLNVEFEDRK